MFNALIIETIKQRILTMPYKLNNKLNKVLASLTSSSGFMKILNWGEKYAKKPAKHPNTGNRKLLLGYEQWKAEAKVTRTRFTHSWRNNSKSKNVQPRRVGIALCFRACKPLRTMSGLKLCLLFCIGQKDPVYIRSNIWILKYHVYKTCLRHERSKLCQ